MSTVNLFLIEMVVMCRVMSVFGNDPPNLSTEDAMRDSLQNLLPPDQKSNFMSLFSKFLLQKQQTQKYITALDSYTEPEPETILSRDNIPPCPEDAALRRELLDKLVIVRLNGGLGSTMGCHTIPKCAIEVRNGLSFLDLSIKQIEYLNSLHGVDLPIIYLNSFKTHQITTKLIRRYRRHNLTIHTVLQNCFPRISKTTLMPVASMPFQPENAEEWYPPGHGDLYYSLWSSGVLDSLLHDGKEYAFISNIDNLCATVDFDMLYHIYCNETEMCVESTQPNRTDTDGGYLTVSPSDGKIRLVEISEISADKRDEFKRRHKYFNTNNIWVNLRALKRMMDTIDIRDRIIVTERELETGLTVLQLETTVGSLISKIRSPLIISVPRKIRYVPVKTTADLLLIQSDLFTVKHGALILNGDRMDTPLPLVKLGKEFSAIDDYQKRIPKKHPNILELEHLTIAGDVYIGANVTLSGTVIIIAVDGSVIMIPDGSVLVDKVVTGNLRILDH